MSIALAVIASEAKQSSSFFAAPGLLRFARNDGKYKLSFARNDGKRLAFN
jgi:hypothetical protein